MNDWWTAKGADLDQMMEQRVRQPRLCVPDELFGVAGLVFVFSVRNPKIWKHIRERVGALHGRRWDPSR